MFILQDGSSSVRQKRFIFPYRLFYACMLPYTICVHYLAFNVPYFFDENCEMYIKRRLCAGDCVCEYVCVWCAETFVQSFETRMGT